MAARAIWTGSRKIDSRKLPVKLYSAVEDQSIHFRILYEKTRSRVKQHMVNPETGEEVAREDIRKGYELDSDQMRSPEDIGLAKPGHVPPAEVKKFEKFITKHSKPDISLGELRDDETEKLLKLVEHKREQNKDVILGKVDEAAPPKVIDLMEVLRKNLKGKKAA